MSLCNNSCDVTVLNYMRAHLRTSNLLYFFNVSVGLSYYQLVIILGGGQCDQIGQFIGLWATFKAFGNN